MFTFIGVVTYYRSLLERRAPGPAESESGRAANCMVLHPACHDDSVSFYPLFSMGLSPEEREALQKAASAEDRPMAYVARRAVVAWLKEQRWLKK